MERGIRHVGVLGFDGVNAVDLVGPLEAFANAGRADCTSKHSKGAYQLHVIGVSGRPFAAESGIRVLPDCQLSDAPPMDTLIIPGGWGLREPATNEAVVAWLRGKAPRTRRVASVCTGIYGLAPTGLLDGRRVTTHWRFVEDVARRFPELQVEGNALFLKDGRYYTSGGITAGIDLALALIQEDLGPRAALAVARERLTLPGRTVENVAASVGFANADVFRRRFKRRFGVAPSGYREHFQTLRRRERGKSDLSRAIT